MSTDRETTRVVRSWLEDGVTRLPDRVLDSVLDQLPATPQRRSWWPAWRIAYMNKYAQAAIAAAAVFVVAVVGYNLLPRTGGVGGQPTIAPSPSPSLVARGTFTQETNGGYTVDLECSRTIDGFLWIGGDITESTYSEAPAGTRAAIVFKRGSPVKAIFAWQGNDTRSASCLAFFDDMIAAGGPIREADLGPIEGTVELGS